MTASSQVCHKTNLPLLISEDGLSSFLHGHGGGGTRYADMSLLNYQFRLFLVNVQGGERP